MSQKGILEAALGAKCPQCREGKLFTKGAFTTKFGQMHERCEVCGLKYEVEPGFWYGAMYISYMISVAIFMTVFVALYVLADPAVEFYILATVLASGILYPVTFRSARIIYLYGFGGIKYQPSLKKQ